MREPVKFRQGVYIFRWIIDPVTHMPIPAACLKGSDSGVTWARVDGRFTDAAIRDVAEKLIKDFGGCGYSVGFITTHELNPAYFQSRIRYTDV